MTRHGHADSAVQDVEVVVLDGDPAPYRAQLIQLWVDVTEAGGAVGFRPPVTGDEVAPAVDDLLAEVAAGGSRLVIALHDATLVGIVAITPGPAPRVSHRVTLRRLQVHPSLQGQRVGARMVDLAHELASAEYGSELALATVRDGLGLDRFYRALGYVECGRIPGGLAFDNGDRIDELIFVRALR